MEMTTTECQFVGIGDAADGGNYSGGGLNLDRGRDCDVNQSVSNDSVGSCWSCGTIQTTTVVVGINRPDVFGIALMVSIAVAAILGNSAVVWIVYRNVKLRTVPNRFVLNLALCDLLTAVLNGPFTTVVLLNNERWVMGDVMCQINGFLTTFFGLASVVMLAVISMNRCCMVVYTKTCFHVFTSRNTNLMILGVWLFSAACAFPPMVGWSSYHFVPGKAICTLLWSTDVSYTLVVIVLGVFSPFAAMVYCYYKIFSRVRSSRQKILSQRVQRAPASEGSEAGSQLASSVMWPGPSSGSEPTALQKLSDVSSMRGRFSTGTGTMKTLSLYGVSKRTVHATARGFPATSRSSTSTSASGHISNISSSQRSEDVTQPPPVSHQVCHQGQVQRHPGLPLCNRSPPGVTTAGFLERQPQEGTVKKASSVRFSMPCPRRLSLDSSSPSQREGTLYGPAPKVEHLHGTPSLFSPPYVPAYVKTPSFHNSTYPNIQPATSRTLVPPPKRQMKRSLSTSYVPSGSLITPLKEGHSLEADLAASAILPYRSKLRRTKSSRSIASGVGEEMRLTVTLFIVITVFLFSWVPISAVNFLETFSDYEIPLKLDRLTVYLVFLQTAVNPIIYGLMNRNFRDGFKSFFCCFVDVKALHTRDK